MIENDTVSAADGDDPPIGLNPRLDAELIARVYRAAGRVHIPDIFDALSAARIHRCLAEETAWQLVLFDGAEHRKLAVASLSELPAAERNRLQAAVDAAATRSFSYRYSNFRLYENHRQGLYRESFLMRVLEFMNAASFRDLMRRIAADPAIDYTDAQATLYRAGDFLTRHDDRVEGKSRRAAYVLNFTPEWIPDWGGLPAFNALNLFGVPMLHAVTQVSSFAPAGRYSITGWLRQFPAGG